jgi:desulfoferrodoxin-like iron-binding protein
MPFNRFLSDYQILKHILKTDQIYTNPLSFQRDERAGKTREIPGAIGGVNARKIYRRTLYGNMVVVKEAGGGELICHNEPVQLVEPRKSTAG